MSTDKKCGHSVPCGCEDTPLTTGTPCETGTPDCPAPDPCPETFCDECLVHCTDTIVDSGIQQGERLDVILQRLTLWILNPGCVTPGASCQSALGLKSTSISTSTIAVQWLPVSTATGYTVEYKQASAVTWILNPVKIPSANPIETDSIGGLLPNTEYHIRVNTTCASGSCYSVIILVKTKQS